MSALFTILVVLIIIASILLVIVVLLQNSKGDGMASNFISANQTLGVRQTADILEKVSWGLMTFILVVSIASSFLSSSSSSSDIDVTDQIEESATQQPAFPSAPVQQSAPAQEAPTQEAPAQEAPAQPAE